jgi:hypothetical protein
VTWVMWNLFLVRLEIVLVSVQDRCTVCTEHTIGIEIVLDTLDGIPRRQDISGSSVWSVWRCATLDARSAHGLRRTYRRLRNSIEGTRRNS